MRIIGKFCIREILDEVVAIPVGECQAQFSGIISLNEVGRFLFEQLSEERTESELIAAVTESYEVDADTAAEDVADFLQILRGHGLLLE